MGAKLAHELPMEVPFRCAHMQDAIDHLVAIAVGGQLPPIGIRPLALWRAINNGRVSSDYQGRHRSLQLAALQTHSILTCYGSPFSLIVRSPEDERQCTQPAALSISTACPLPAASLT